MAVTPIRARRLSLALALAATSLATATSGTAHAAEAGVSPREYETNGPHQVIVVQSGSEHTLYYPADLGSGGRQHPIIIWGNGTGATVADYDFALRHLASWGFVVAAANTGQSGSGQEMLAGARLLIAEDQRPDSTFYGKIDETKIGAAGHSQGGGGAVNAGANELVDTTVPIQPGPQGSVPLLKGPAFFVAGQWDYIVPSFYVRMRYSTAIHVPAVFGEVSGADHYWPGETRNRLLGAVTAWFRFWLSDDDHARGVFLGPAATCGLCQDDAWSSVARNNKAEALPG